MSKQFTTADVAAARAEGRAAGYKAVIDEARDRAVTAERARCDAILNGKEGKARPGLAQHLAFATQMAADAAVALLAKAPMERSAEDRRPRDRLDCYLDDTAAERARDRGAAIVDAALGKTN